ncbi:MAG: glycoside hydrolase family 1 protein [Mycobacterium leprae]
MPPEMRQFPDGFLWGSSTAAHQVEGGNVNNDWWAWEHAAVSTAVEPSGDAIDQFARYAEDFALLASLGQNAHRLSLEWSRIEPAMGEFSRAALDHYRRVLGTLADHGLTGFVTLHHFTNPRWFAERGGWVARDAVEVFERYCAVVSAALGDLIPYACTINEPQIVALFGYLLGHHPPGLRNPALWRRVTQALVRAHLVAVGALRAGAGAPRRGVCLQLPALQPARAGDPACEGHCRELRAETAEVYLDALAAADDPGDFVGVQYYTRMRVDPAAVDGFAAAPGGAPVTQMGWEIHPDGLRQAVHAAARAGLPVVVTENGIATHDDADRVAYLSSHLHALRQAMDEGADVRGYLYWSSFDNFEWAEGYRPTFGLVGIDRDDGLRRVVRPSARLFGQVARTGSLTPLAAGPAPPPPPPGDVDHRT